MPALLTTLLSALVPVGVEGIKQFITAKLGGVRATTIEEQIQLDEHEVRRLEALAQLDNPGGTPSQWVVDLRACSRYIAAWTVILAGVGALFVPTLDASIKALAMEAANIAFGFMFGTRLVAGFKK